jgi:diguanylate cyclase
MTMRYQRFLRRKPRANQNVTSTRALYALLNWALVSFFVFLATLFFSQDAIANQGVTAEPLKITDISKVMSVWSNTRILYDADRSMSVEQAIAALPKFEKPNTPYSTLGVRPEAAWLHVPIETSLGAPRYWVTDIDYPPLNYVDMYLLRDGNVVQKAELGSLRAFASRPLLARSHAMPIALDPASRYDLLVRIDTRGAMILPFTIEAPAKFHSTGLFEQMLQGLLIGIALCLVFYSLGQYASTRERLFGKYALLVFGSMSFTLLQLGIGAQYVWRDVFWIERHIAGISSMIAIGGTFLFLEEALREDDRTSQKRSRFELIMKFGAALAGFIAVLHALDVISLRAMSVIVTVMGPLPSTIATPKMLQQARRGNPVGWYLLLAFTIYMVSVVIITAVIRGKMPVNFWTLHSFQFGATFDMLAFLYVLTLRTKAIRLAAQHASRERDIMRALAHTDPLTGLANRRSLSDALTAALARCSSDNLLAVYVIDLDNFKTVNDTHGHDTGDELLVVAAKRFLANVRSGDIVSRLGGDEFVILASGLRNVQQAEEVGRGLLSTFDEPIALGQRHIKVGLTIGCAIAPLHGKDSMSVLKLADDAMYAGKQAGKAQLTLANGSRASALETSAKATVIGLAIMAAPLLAVFL